MLQSLRFKILGLGGFNVLDKKKILLAVICEDETNFAQQSNSSSNKPIIVHGLDFEFEYLVTVKEKNLAATCNSILSKSNAKYKVFLSTLAVVQNKALTYLLEKFLKSVL